jgi:hypothetical protein
MMVRPSTIAMTEMPALNPVVCVTGVFRCEDSAIEEEGEVDGEMEMDVDTAVEIDVDGKVEIDVDAAVEIDVDPAVDAEAEADVVVVEFVSALEPHSPQDVWHPTPQYVSSPPQYPWDEQQLPHIEPVQIKPVDPPHEPVVLIEELTP